jgi:hypothetical protein
MQSKATSVQQYLAELPDDRREAIEAVRKVIRRNLHKDYEEGIQYGCISYHIPHRVYPPGYHCDPKQALPFICLTSQKNYMSLHLMCIYGSQEQSEWFKKEWKKTGKKLDMGKACVRFKKLDDVPLELIGQLVKRITPQKLIAMYDSVAAKSVRSNKKKPPTRSTATKKISKAAPSRRMTSSRSAR